VAILGDFRKVRQEATTVEYRSGPPPTVDRRLLIEVSTGQGRPLEGKAASSFHSVLRKIRRGRESLGRWPESGSYAA
jgi:hypothetical protein